MKKKKFDCVEMMHRAGRKIDQETKNLTFQQKVEYWRKKSEEAARRQAERTKAFNQAAPLNYRPAFWEHWRCDPVTTSITLPLIAPG